MGIVCLAGIFAVFLLLAWTLCRAAGWEKEREDLEQEQYLKEWRGEKVKKNEKNCKKRLAFFYTDDIIILALQIQAPLAQLVEQ